MELLVNSEEMMKKLIAAAEVDKEKFVRYWPLRRAIQQDDWKAVGEFTRDNYPQVFTDKISEISSTFFHVIVLLDNDAAISLLRENVPKFTESVLAKDASGATALSLAAALGNKKAVEIIVNSCPDSPNALLSMGPMSNILPIHLAAIFGHEEVVQFLLPRTRLLIEETQNQFLLVLFLLGVSNPLGITFRVFKNQLRDRGLHPKQKEWILGTLAAKPKWFKSGSRIGFLQRFIYSCIPVKDDNMPSPQAEKTDFQNPGSVDGDTEIPRQISEISASTFNSGMRQKLKSMFWNVLMQLATRLGILEIVEEILKVYDSALFFVDEAGKNVLQLAVLNRQEIVFGFMLKEAGKFLSQYMDNDLNNILHLAGKSSTSSKIAGSVLQMQREVQWFKAVENFVLPSMREMKNKESKTPREVFEEEHKTLVKEGENSMKGSATSCSVVAALIITIAFAAAFTVPGGGTNTKGPAFIIFAISDALAFVSSTASVLMFLGILTMRYSPDDFLKSLPEKYRPNHLVLFYCKHDGSLWCNVLHQLHSSMEMDYLPNFPSY
ncbi:ankyrin repeat-containing protein ITN1-like isoform X2 [Pistacia vera]|uniref:ankyrin repeat-containing protein ITN1-like isoform X2 n=1 Tax=Pistacia vera TaxID=55513 RepID=UPI0012631947|nr:ankyrin repeat-containing protein ITN1-like isoform X2 [Pistacia vera]